MLEDDIERWLDICGSREILTLLRVAEGTITSGRKVAPSTCLAGILSIKTLLLICLERHPNAVLPRKALSQAIINVHAKSPIYLGSRCMEIVAAESRDIIRGALEKVRRGR